MREELFGYHTDDKLILCDQWHETLTQRYLRHTEAVRILPDGLAVSYHRVDEHAKGTL